MLNLIRKDLLLMLSTKVNLLVIILYIPLMNLILGASDPGRTIAITIISCGYILNIISFAYEKTSKPRILIQSLPVKKRDVVISKYMSIFINYIFAVIFTGGYLWIISLFGFRTVDSFNLSLVKDTLLILVFSLCISLPLHFRLPPKVANFTNGFILILVINTIGIGTKGINSMFNANATGSFQLLIVVAVIWLLSMGLSMWLYERKDMI